ncbi:MAG TPA: hypothetical protein ENK43_12905 [Planctomycetes bacterium]|nr:hypothetical protein [Planctomycetota bacterium]
MPPTLDEKLDAFLADLAKEPLVQRLNERAEDAGHLSEDQLTALFEGTVSDEEAEPLRRHLLFCDVCSTIPLEGVEEAVEESGGKSSVLVGRPPSAPPLDGRRRVLWLLASGVGGVAVAGGALWWLRRQERKGVREEPKPAGLSYSFCERVALSPDGGEREGDPRGDETLAVAFSTDGAPESHTYVLLLRRDGHLQIVAPVRGETAVAAPSGVLHWTPPAAAPDAQPRRGWAAEELGVGWDEEFALLLLSSSHPVPELEGPIAVTSTLPILGRDLLAPKRPLGASEFADFARRVQSAGLVEVVRLIVTRWAP